MDKIVIEFLPTPQDFARASYSFSTRNRSEWIVRGLIAILILALGFLLFSGIAAGVYSITFITLLLLCFLGFVLFLPFITYWQTVRTLSKKGPFLRPIFYEFSDDGILIFNSLQPSKYDWAFFGGVYETKEDYFLAYSSDHRFFQFFVRRAFLSVEQENSLRSLLQMKLGKITDLEKGMHGWALSIITFTGIAAGLVLCGLVFFIYSL